MQSVIAFVFLFCLRTISLAADVTIYDGHDYYSANPGTELKPIAESQFPWKFSYRSGDTFYIHFYWKNESPSVTVVNFTCTTEFGTFLVKNYTETYGPRRGEKYYHVDGYEVSKCTEIEIVLNLYESNISCSSLSIVKGREVANISNEALIDYYDVHRYYGCVLEVDLLNQCDGTLVTERNISTTTARMVTDFKNLNNTFIVPTSTHKNLETTTNQTTGNNTSANSTNITVIIVGSISGVTFTLLVIIAIWKRCWIKHSPQGTPDLPMNQNFQPFYVNMLFRRECALEIAELDQHVYEEINPRDSEGPQHYEEINPQVSEGSGEIHYQNCCNQHHYEEPPRVTEGVS